VLTDWLVIQALTRAADCGVKVWIYLDRGRFSEEGSKAFQALAETPGCRPKGRVTMVQLLRARALAITSAVFVAIGAMSRADLAPTIHYAPAENLEHIDLDLTDTALTASRPATMAALAAITAKSMKSRIVLFIVALP
jgi:hypothetical protein